MLLRFTEAILKYLKKKKQDKVEEIKKKTGYNSTRDLIEKYDEAIKRVRRRFRSSRSTKLH